MRVNIFIRKENQEIWNQITNKSDWVNVRLQDFGARGQRNARATTLEERAVGLGEAVELPKTPRVKLCKHGSSKGECFHKESARLRCNIV